MNDSEVDQELIEWQSSEGCDRGLESSWRPVVSGVAQVHYWVQPYSSFNQQSGQREKVQGIISKFAENMELE